MKRRHPPRRESHRESLLHLRSQVLQPLLLGSLLAILGNLPLAAAPAQWQVEQGHRSAALPVPISGNAGFRLLLSAETGVIFTNLLSQERSLTNQIYLNGSGVALGDVNGDGRCDIYLCGLDNPNALFENLGGWKFKDVTSEAGVACADQASTGAAFADVDGDGDMDLLVGGIRRGVRLFVNDGRGRFQETTERAGLTSTGGATSLALADIDGDGLLDLYLANYRSWTLRDEPDTRFRVATTNNQFSLLAVNGVPVTAPELVGRFTIDRAQGILENGEADVVYRNLGDGRFAPLSWTDGTFLDEQGKPISIPYEWALSVMFRDLNGDSAPDIYVCNDFHSEDRIWINDGKGRFRAAAPLAFRHTSLFTMGVDVADVDRDGHDDIFVADMLSRAHERRQVQVADRKMSLPVPGVVNDRPQYSRNMFFWNRGDDAYAEIAQLSDVQAADWCWCPLFLDVDLDGYEDLLMITGHERDAQNIDLSRQIVRTLQQRPVSRVAQLHLRKIFPVYDTPNFAFRNKGDLTFEEVGQAWGFDSTQVSQGIAVADLDNDGDLDGVINCLNAPPLLYRNESPAARVAVRLRGSPPNTQGIGGSIRVFGGAVERQSQEVICGGHYLSSDEPMRVFAAGGATNALRIEVTWRSGRQSVVTNARPNRLYEIHETASVPATPVPKREVQPLFQDASDLLRHTHVDVPYDDFQRQPLLTRRLSQGGPGISWFDLDADGWEDLVVGSGRGGKLALFRNNRQGGFEPIAEPAFGMPVTRDQTTVLGVQLAGRAVLLAGSANYEDGLTNGSVVRLFDLAARKISDAFPGQLSTTGPLALGDADGDGDLDLFVGGQVIPGRYPEAASSWLFRNEAGVFRLDPAASAAFRDVGLVNAALWTDFDADGQAELVLACEWGPVRIFRRSGAGWVDVTATWGMDAHLGWWQSVHAGDFNNDGRMDLVAGNWGRNSKYQSFLREPLRIYYGNLHGDPALELIEACFDPNLKAIVPWRDWETLAKAMPFIHDKYENFTQFSTAAVREILGSRESLTKSWSANTLDTMVFMNRGDRFEARSLAIEGQLAPVFGLAVADFDGDGNEDVFLAQNFFALPPDPSRSRYDAGRGALFAGDGRGRFKCLSSAQSGIAVYGEGRGAAVCDFDGDGRVDLAVGQNASKTKLFRNEAGRPGLRVRLAGPAMNLAGIGARIRVEYDGGRLGPCRELHAGSGHWSQDAAVQVLGLAEPPRFVQVSWPGGKTARVPVPPGAAEVTVRWN